ncbi:P-loop containing nucleoside triphosphate hydrolase protein [Ramaria rubella]|nr:P-loop containing nucleoside triphosphate hydrolase protein [Ramaria rubella]
MQVGSSNLLHTFHALVNRSFQHEFHTSSCVLKGTLRSRNKYGRTKADTHRPARTRLVPTLKPTGNSGIYEVAPRQSKSRNRIGGNVEGVISRTGPEPSRSKEISSIVSSGFTRDKAPHEGRTSWHPPKGSIPSRRGPAWEGQSGRNRSAYSGSYGINNSPRRREDLRRSNEFFRGATRSDNFRTSSAKIIPGKERAFQDELKPVRSVRSSHSRWSDGLDNSRSFENDISYSQVNISRQPYVFPKGPGSERSWQSKNFIPEEFDTSTEVEPLKTLPNRFTSPPLLEGLLQSVHDVLGSDAKPSPIQSLSMKHLFAPPAHIVPIEQAKSSNTPPSAPLWSQYLLASETGSGKSIAYLLPMIQYLKLTENSPAPLSPSAPPPSGRSLPLNPRGLILAPTHELSRQLSSFAKSLLHNVRLRVLCGSRANNSSSSRGRNSTASQLKRELDDLDFTDSENIVRRSRPVDVLVATPTKILEMTRGWGWNRKGRIEEQWDDARKERARNWVAGPPEAGLACVEWVVVDEADILFDQDFQESTRMLLADISCARGYVHPSFPSLNVTDSESSSPATFSKVAYPFHFLLTSATIPSSLATYLSAYHPTLTRLASPKLHQLPSTLKTEHHAWTSGNKNSDIEKRVKRVWTDDAAICSPKSKILIFCNKSSKVDDLSLYLQEKGIPNVALTSSGGARQHGSNRHLDGFLRTKDESSLTLPIKASTSEGPSSPPASPSEPHVMITTSLLSRGLDFSPQIKHVFIVDEPRNMIDFLHRAGRSGRAGHEGKVVIFGKIKGRGAGSAKEVKRKISALAH